MKHLLLSLTVSLILVSCMSSDSGPTSPPPPSGGLTATPASIRIAPGANAAVSISSGTRPEAIVLQPNGSVATASLNDTTLTIHAVAVGSTSVRIGDDSSPRKTVDISISVATSAAAMMFSKR